MAPEPEHPGRVRDALSVEVWRGDEIESVHRVHAVVADADGHTPRTYGESGRRAFLRSSAKPVQAIPTVESGAAEKFGLTTEEIAVTTASHNAEPYHIEAVRSILDKAGLDESDLQCGPHDPMHAPSAEALRDAGERPGRIHNNCSGKHAGMLATCRAEGWPLVTYRDPDHPLQRRIRALICELSGIADDEIGVAVDGCGAATFSIPISAMAVMFARLARVDRTRDDPLGQAVGVIFDAMATCPEYVAGSDRLCTEIMRGQGSRTIAKTGAEGVYAAARRGEDHGLALKVADGARRAQDVALVALLEALGWVDPVAGTSLERFLHPQLSNWGDELVGRIDIASTDGVGT